MNRITRLRVLGLLTAGLLVFAVGCGGSSSESSSSTTTASSSASTASSSATTASGGSGGDASNCADLYTKFSSVGDNFTSAMTGTGTADWDAVISQMNSLTSSVPSEVRSDWQTFVNGVKQLATDLNGVDLKNMTDPAVAAKVSAATAAFTSPAMTAAQANLSAYFDKLCPSLADK